MQKKMTTKTTAFVGMLAAIFVVLALLSVGTNNFKASFETLAVLIAGFVLGPVPALLVGIVGEFVYQLLYYGLDPTTPLWLLPYALEGLLAGLLVLKAKENGVSKREFFGMILGSELLLTVLVTLVNWASAVIQGWGNWALIAAGIPLRLGITAIRIIVYMIVIPLLYGRLRKVVK